MNLPILLASGVACFVFLFFYAKFNHWTPAENTIYTDSPPRHYTTWLRYSAFAVVYSLFNVFLFTLILLFPDSALYLLKLVEDGGVISLNIPENSEILSHLPIWGALIVTTILPALPNKMNLDNYIRRKLHYRAFITKEADKTIEDLNLNFDGFNPDIDTIDKVIAGCESLDDQNPFLENANTINHKWSKQCYLTYQFNHWPTWWEIKNRFEGYNIKWKEIESTHKDLAAKYEEYIQLETLQRENEENRKSESSLYKFYQDELSRLLDEQLQKLYLLISVCILATQKTTQLRKSSYNHFGLNPRSSFTIPFDWDIIIKLTGLVFITTLIPAMLYFATSSLPGTQSDIPVPEGFTGAMTWSILSLGLQASAVLITIYLSKVWFKNQNAENNTNHRNMVLTPSNVRRVCCAGASYATGFTILFLFTLLTTGFNFELILQAIQKIAPWPLVCAVTGYFVAMYFGAAIQNEPKSEKECRKRHIRYSLIQGATTAFVGVLAALLYFNRMPGVAEAPFMAFIFTTMLIIGTGVGYIILNGYWKLRQNLSRRNHGRITTKENIEVLNQDKILPCQITNISLEGAYIDKRLDQSIKNPILIKFEDIGEVYARVVRRQESNTSIQFLHDKSTKNKMKHYLNQHQGIAA